jgi:membrane protein implicated in regulation of membrane protease activity
MNAIHPSAEWIWLIGGVLLLIAELIAPGYSLIFVGAAALATGLLALLFPLSTPIQLGVFAILAVMIVRVGVRRAYAARYDHSSEPLLNNPAARLLGRVVVVTEAVNRNSGRVRVGDGEWSARGEPAAVGDRVRIVDVEGNCLKVEPEHHLPQD